MKIWHFPAFVYEADGVSELLKPHHAKAFVVLGR